MPNDLIKEHYNQEVVQDSGGNYEKYRWFSSTEKEAGYRMTKETIERQLINKIKKMPINVLEFGPGPGTWTKVLSKSWPSSNFDLVDISEAMLNQARGELTEAKARFFESDLENFSPDKTYDLVFSSRMIEYLADKEVLGQKLAQALANGGTGFIITKTPHPWFSFLRRRIIPERHRLQISPRQLAKLLRKHGFKIERFSVATISVPLFHSPKLNLLAFKILSRLPFNFFTAVLSESYAVRFKKTKIVEIFGLPGAGKTSLAKKLQQQNFTIIKIASRWELLRLSLTFVCLHPIIFSKLLWRLLRESHGPTGLLRSKLINLIGHSSAKWIKAKKFDRAVLDQGFWQNCLSLFEHQASISEMKSLAAIFPCPDELLIVETDPNHRAARVAGRGYHTREDFGFDYAKSWRSITEANYQTFKKILPEINKPKYFFV